MKNKGFTILAIGLMVSAFAAADDLVVNNAAAMGGSGTACSGGPCGLQVHHDNSSKAYVQDDSPNLETIYRADFLFDPNSFATGAGKFRQNIFALMSPTPDNPTYCPGTIMISSLRVYVLWKNGDYTLQARGRGNLCGESATLPRTVSIADGPVKICVEIEFGNSLSGRVALAVVGTAESCPTSGDPAWASRNLSNGALQGVEQARLGSLAVNNFAAGEDGYMFFDEFQSFRTLTP